MIHILFSIFLIGLSQASSVALEEWPTGCDLSTIRQTFSLPREYRAGKKLPGILKAKSWLIMCHPPRRPEVIIGTLALTEPDERYVSNIYLAFDHSHFSSTFECLEKIIEALEYEVRPLSSKGFFFPLSQLKVVDLYMGAAEHLTADMQMIGWKVRALSTSSWAEDFGAVEYSYQIELAPAAQLIACLAYRPGSSKL